MFFSFVRLCTSEKQFLNFFLKKRFLQINKKEKKKSELRLQETQDSRSTRYPLQEICRQDNIQTNGQRIIDDYPNIYVIWLIGKQKKTIPL